MIENAGRGRRVPLSKDLLMGPPQDGLVVVPDENEDEWIRGREL
jgi:hypothetical protein